MPLGTQNIILIGMMGSSKTTTGRVLAERTGRMFLDTDELFESVYGDISKTFMTGGEKLFRQRESELMLSLCETEGSIIALGGGSVLNTRAMQLLRQTGIVVLLYANTQRLLDRLKLSGTKRPMLEGTEVLRRIEQLCGERAPIYHEYADFAVDNSQLSPEETAGLILEHIELLDELQNQTD